jgi:putative transposase
MGGVLTLTELRRLALDLRRQDGEYQQLYSQVVQEIADCFYAARQRFLKGLAKRFPREKKPHKYYSLTCPQSGWKILSVREIRTSRKNRKKLVVFRVVVHRDFPVSKVRRVTVKLTKSERIYISFIVESQEFPQLPKTGRAVAVDVGLEKLLVTSDGEFLPNLRPYKKALDKIRRLHKALSRKKYLSRNWFKAKVKLARACEHMANLRRDIFRKLGKYFAGHYDVVVMEDIDVKQLVGRVNRELGRSLQDAAFGMMRSIIRYQVEKYWKRFVLVGPGDSSRTCAKCGCVKEDLTLNDRVFECPVCGWKADRDHNSAPVHLRRAGWEPPAVPVEPSPLPAACGCGQGGAVRQEAPPLRAG